MEVVCDYSVGVHERHIVILLALIWLNDNDSLSNSDLLAWLRAWYEKSDCDYSV
ncbi:MAG: hypothetical protein ACYDEJ_00380 [Desulfitobacteriaceae bacterium]